MPWNFIWKHSFINQYPSKCKIMQILSHKKSMFEILIVMFFKLLQKNNNKRQQDEWHLEHKDYLHVQKQLLVTSCKESTCQCRRCKRHGFDPWVGKIPWRRKRLPTLVFLSGKSHGQRSLMGYSPQGHKELDTTEHIHTRSKHTHTCE